MTPRRAMISMAASLLTLLLLSSTMGAPTARAADQVRATGVVKDSAGQPCSTGTATLYYWNSSNWAQQGSVPIANGVFVQSITSWLKGKSVTVKVACYDPGATWVATWYGYTSSWKPGEVDTSSDKDVGYDARWFSAPTSQDSRIVDASDVDFGTIVVPRMVAVRGRISLSDGSEIPGIESGCVGGILSRLDFHKLGANPNTDTPLSTCETSNKPGESGKFECAVPEGTYDLWAYGNGTRPGNNYPNLGLKTAAFTVPSSGIDALALRLAEGPAVRVITRPKLFSDSDGNVVRGGSTVSASNYSYDASGYPDPSFSYEWLVDGQVRSTRHSYTIPVEDAGRTIVFRVTISQPGRATGSGTSEPIVIEAAAPQLSKANSTLTIKFSKLKRNVRGRASVKVKVAGMTPTGRVTISEGSATLGTKKMANRNHGKVTIVLKALKKGSHTITVSYAGTNKIQSASRSTVRQVK